MLRVLQLIPTLGGGGAERQLSLLAAPLREQGVELHVGFQRGGVNHSRLEESGAYLHQIAIESYNDPRILMAIIRLIRSMQPDVVHTWLMSMDTAGGLAARWCGVPWLMSERTAPQAYNRPRLKDHVRRHLARYASGVIGNSPHGLDFWRTVIPADRRYLLPNAVPIDEVDRTAPIARAALPLPQELPLVVYAGRFATEKNVGVLVDAIIELAAQGEAVALLCGEGPDRERFEPKIRDAGLSERIAVSGYRDDLRAILRAADCAVSLSSFEGSANVVLEAMACSCPLVLSDIPAHRADADDAAWYVDWRDSAAVAATIRTVLSARGEAQAKAARGRMRAAHRTPHRCAQQLAGVYRHTSQARHKSALANAH